METKPIKKSRLTPIMDKTKDAQFYLTSARRIRNRDLGRHGKKIILCSRRLQLSFQNPGDIYNTLGMLFFNSNGYSQSAKKLKKATIINPKRADTWEYLGEAQLALGKDEEGFKCLKVAMSMTPSDLLHKTLIKALYERGKVEEIEQIYEEIDKILPAGTHKGYFYYVACLVLEEFGLFSHALIFSRKTLRSFPQQGSFYLQYAKLLKKEGFLQDAIEAFRKAICIEPSYCHFYIHIAMLWYNLGETQKAIDELNAAREFPLLDDSVTFYIVLMRYHLSEGQNEIEKEKDKLIKALKADSNSFYKEFSEELQETQFKLQTQGDEKAKEFMERKIKALTFVLSWIEKYHHQKERAS